jgi:predicted DNA-binding transcriptional regulator YafY
LLDGSLRPAPAPVRALVGDGVDIGPIRGAIRDRRKVEICYADAGRKETTRIVWPFLIAFMDEVRVVVAHCELRDGFRHFRTDRIREARTLDVKYPAAQRTLMTRWEETFPWRA